MHYVCHFGQYYQHYMHNDYCDVSGSMRTIDFVVMYSFVPAAPYMGAVVFLVVNKKFQ